MKDTLDLKQCNNIKVRKEKELVEENRVEKVKDESNPRQVEIN